MHGNLAALRGILSAFEAAVKERALGCRDPQPNADPRVVSISSKELIPVIAIYIVTKNMTREQHTKGRERLREAGAPESAMKVHSCFGEDGQLQVFDVWDSQEAFDEFLTYLGPVMAEMGIELAQPPTIMPIVDLVQQ